MTILALLMLVTFSTEYQLIAGEDVGTYELPTGGY